MARTPLLETVQRAAAEAAAEDRSTTRRGFLRDAAVAGAATTAFGVFAQRSRAAVPAGRVVVVGGGLAGLTCAYRLEAGRAPGRAATRPPIGSAGAAGRGAATFADGQIAEHGGELIDQGHTADPPARAGARAEARQPALGRGERHRAVLLLRRRAVLVRRGDRRPQGDLAADPQGRLGGRATRRSTTRRPSAGASSTRCRSPTGSRQYVPGGHGLEARASCSTSPTTSSTAPRRTCRARSTCSTCSGTRGQGQLRIFGESNEKYHVRGGNDQIPRGSPTRCRARSRPARS